ncbi:siderophore-interacting protein [Corynebacterium phocae]|nr:siderophore-interacting protein [Corynebacterium phocae]
MEAARTELYTQSREDYKRAKYEAKAQKRREKQRERERRRESFLNAGATPAAPKPANKRRVNEATVTGRQELSPNMVRIFANAPGLQGMDLDKTDHYIKIIFAPPGAQYCWPFDFEEAKKTQPKDFRPVTRTYTLRRVDTRTGDMAIDFVIHGDAGIAGPWARDVEVGATFGFRGPGGGWSPTADYDHFVLAGDESASPAIAAGLEKIPAGSTAIAFVEVEAEGHQMPMPEREDVEVRFVMRNGAMPGTALSRAVRNYTPPAGHTAWFIHGVAEMVKDLRRNLFVERQVAKKDASVSGYWRLKMTEDQWQATKHTFVAEMEAQESS